MALLDIRDLKVDFVTPRGTVRAVDGFSCSIERGESVALVGESGCGKSVTAMSILGLLPHPAAKVSGEILFEGHDLLSCREAELKAVRGNAIGMIFQEPMTSLNPVLTIGRQITEVLRVHRKLTRHEAKERAAELLDQVGISEARHRLNEYPHQLSGGMRQRVMIAIALACDPQLLIADEPTTALDVTIQAQILSLLDNIGRRSGASILLITHDLGVVAQSASRVVVMYAGRTAEEASAQDLFATPQHPYTRGLMKAVPKLGVSAQGGRRGRLAEIPGVVPSALEPIVGCAFAERCSLADDRCRMETPFPRSLERHLVACHKAAGFAGVPA